MPKCELCGFYCHDDDKFDRHLFERHPGYCDLCDKQLQSKASLDRHVLDKHHLIPCDKCSNCASTIANHKQHFRDNHLISCRVCHMELFDAEQRKDHMQLAHGNRRGGQVFQVEVPQRVAREPSQLPCDSCSATFSSIQQYKQHFRESHAISCPFCNMQLLDNIQRDEHTRLAHNLRCGQCKEVFRTEELRQAHFNSSHAVSSPQFECVVCNKPHETDAERREHYKLLHDFRSCPLCDEIFQSNAEREEHHKAVHNFECFLCDKSFKTDVLFEKHLAGYHSKCELCGKVYSTEASLQDHYTRIHEESASSSSDASNAREQVPPCSICAEVFHNEVALIEHYKQIHIKD